MFCNIRAGNIHCPVVTQTLNSTTNALKKSPRCAVYIHDCVRPLKCSTEPRRGETKQQITISDSRSQILQAVYAAFLFQVALSFCKKDHTHTHMERKCL